MTRLLGLVVLGFLIWVALEVLLGRVRVSLSGRMRVGMPPRGGRPAVEAEALVRCAVCGTYVPRSRAVRRAGEVGEGGQEVFCSERCAAAAVTPVEPASK